MSTGLTLAIAQCNPVVGDIPGNSAKARAARAAAGDADLVILSELFLIGYPPEDLVVKPALLEDCRAAVQALAAETGDGGPAILIGTPWKSEAGLHNAVALLVDGKVAAVRFKNDLPNYGVFDEKRVFLPGPLPAPVTFHGHCVGVPICEDIWTPPAARSLADHGATLIISPNGSPFHKNKMAERLARARGRAAETGLPVIYANQLGGQDELVFDGASFAIHPDGEIVCQLADFEEQIARTEWQWTDKGWRCVHAPHATIEHDEAAIYQALMLGLRDYVNKNRFPGVLIGLSGGIDSALTAAIATDALGAERVECVMMPSRYTSQASLDDAAACARALGVQLDTIAIDGPVAAVEDTLKPFFKTRPADATEENIQSRARGVTLMALSNKFGKMVMTTGNKSELSVGYATLYGDMCGGFNALKDVYKTEVYALARWRNETHPRNARGPAGAVIPKAILTKAPSAELRPNQRDEDSLPPYDVLDDILRCLIEQDMSVAEIAARGHDAHLVRRVEHMVYMSEYKRRQAAPGIKVGTKIFGRDRRYPITNGFRDAP